MAGPDVRPVVIRIDKATTLEGFVEETSARLGEPCLFVWGDVGELPGARPGAIAWSDGQIALTLSTRHSHPRRRRGERNTSDVKDGGREAVSAPG